MWKSKKFIMILALAVVALIGGTTGAVLAATDDETGATAETQREALLDRICEIYEENNGVAIDPDQLQSALDQAREEMREQAAENQLQAMVDDGTITQEEADAFLEWWQARPDVEGLMGGLREGPWGCRGGGMMMGGGHLRDSAPYCGNTSCDITGGDESGVI